MPVGMAFGFEDLSQKECNLLYTLLNGIDINFGKSLENYQMQQELLEKVLELLKGLQVSRVDGVIALASKMLSSSPPESVPMRSNLNIPEMFFKKLESQRLSEQSYFLQQLNIIRTRQKSKALGPIPAPNSPEDSILKEKYAQLNQLLAHKDYENKCLIDSCHLIVTKYKEVAALAREVHLYRFILSRIENSLSIENIFAYFASIFEDISEADFTPGTRVNATVESVILNKLNLEKDKTKTIPFSLMDKVKGCVRNNKEDLSQLIRLMAEHSGVGSAQCVSEFVLSCSATRGELRKVTAQYRALLNSVTGVYNERNRLQGVIEVERAFRRDSEREVLKLREEFTPKKALAHSANNTRNGGKPQLITELKVKYSEALNDKVVQQSVIEIMKRDNAALKLENEKLQGELRKYEGNSEFQQLQSIVANLVDHYHNHISTLQHNNKLQESNTTLREKLKATEDGLADLNERYNRLVAAYNGLNANCCRLLNEDKPGDVTEDTQLSNKIEQLSEEFSAIKGLVWQLGVKSGQNAITQLNATRDELQEFINNPVYQSMLDLYKLIQSTTVSKTPTAQSGLNFLTSAVRIINKMSSDSIAVKDRLISNYASQNQVVKQLQCKVEDLCVENQTLRNNLSDLNNILEANSLLLTENITGCHVEGANTCEQCKLKHHLLSKYEVEVKEMDLNTTMLSNDNNSFKDQIKSLTADLKQTQFALNEKNIEINFLKSQNRELSNQVQSLTKSVHAYQVSTSSHNAQWITSNEAQFNDNSNITSALSVLNSNMEHIKQELQAYNVIKEPNECVRPDGIKQVLTTLNEIHHCLQDQSNLPKPLHSILLKALNLNPITQDKPLNVCSVEVQVDQLPSTTTNACSSLQIQLSNLSSEHNAVLSRLKQLESVEHSASLTLQELSSVKQQLHTKHLEVQKHKSINQELLDIIKGLKANNN